VISSPIVRVHNLETTFFTKWGTFKAVNGLSYDIAQGETLGIVGESGCGKSVTAFSLMGVVDPPGKVTAGDFFLSGREVLKLNESQMQRIRGKDMAMIFQEPMTALNPILTIGFQIDEQILRHERVSAAEARNRSIEMLRMVGVPAPESRYKSYLHQLSGGMRQRAMIAMALSCDPAFLIADEPTTALDMTIQSQILDVIQSLQEKRKMTVQFISHDLGVIFEVSDRVLVMYGGLACETATTQELFYSPKHPYTAALIESIPKLGSKMRRLPTIEGTVPAAFDLPKGCPFQTRCPRSKIECRDTRPPIQMITPTQSVACFNPL
jgi:peptide/nickel transport system ATP-binding protein